ncbi:hypothetical protein [Treponema zioleckii]|uniref:hypothetical protein n=1 Tax=Treponema zioleckii TaxID=331680 RepID=UPI00168AD085|nr:hypothetical protein [Treponema zioleckii]
MKASFAKITLFLIAILYLASCGNSLDDMLDNYNKNFSGGGSEVSKSEIEPVIDEKELLLDSYVVSQIATLNLAAPYSFSDYKWVVQDADTLETIEVNTDFDTTDSTRKFILYIPTSNLKAQKSYRLCLNLNDGEYTDAATLAVYNDYFFNTGIVTIPPTIASSVSSSAMRSILPDSSICNASNYKIKAYAKNKIYDSKSKFLDFRTSDIFADLNSNTGYLTFNERGYWDITLFFIPNDTTVRGQNKENSENDDDYLKYLMKIASLSAISTIDNRYESKEVSFKLLPVSGGENSGSAELMLYANGWTPDSATESFSAKILTSSDSTDAAVLGAEQPLVLVTDSASAASITFTDLPTGTHRFVLSGTYNNGTDEVTCEWSDSIVIVAGQTTKKTIGIPRFINRSGT